VTVEDNGIGISAAYLPHIFERFYRADPSRSHLEGLHQARLSVESRESAGSTFRIVFPASAADSSSAWAPGSEDRAARMAARE